MKCPKCFKKVKGVKAYYAFTKTFNKLSTWKYCPNCDGYIQTRDCLIEKGDGK